jgi:3-hydroxybutyryl-CoA dehydrogenase
MKNFATDPLTLGIIGAGIMGRGIAQIAASAGIEVLISDTNPAVTAQALEFVHKMIDRAVEKGRMDGDRAAAAKAGIRTASSLADMNRADIVVEAVIESLEVKQSLFGELERIVSQDCILATNTSSLSVTAVATACENQERVAGCHFFNPVPLMKLVEVIGGVRTSRPTVDQLVALIKRLGHTPAEVRDAPGFLVNHLGRGLNTEGLRILFESVAQVQDIDEVMRDCVGLRMGPFELMDLTGLDVTCPANEQIYAQYYQEPRVRPTPLLRQHYVAGILGRKTGHGFYAYDNGTKVETERPAAPPAPTGTRIWVSPAIPEFSRKVTGVLEQARVELDQGEQPAGDSIIIVTPVGTDTTSACITQGLDPARTLGLDALFNMDKRLVLMANPATTEQAINDAWAMCATSGRAVTVIRDSAGFIAQRIVANIINTACDIAQEGVARPQDIDTGARLGLGYPNGPLALGDDLGSGRVLEILENLHKLSGDPRYRPSIWLRRRAMLGLSLLHTENA